MWHEARKQERKIRGMLVDYRKRAERRRDFYEKIKADPTQFLQVHGRQCKIHLDPVIAAAADGPATMMPWQGQKDNLIDRFDVRAHLDFIPAVKNDEDFEITYEERQINYERYRIIAQNSFLAISEERFLKQLHMEEQFGYTENEPKPKKKSGGAAIGFNYEDGTGPSPSTYPIEEENSDENSDSDLDVDLSINVSKLDQGQAHEMNRHGRNFGMSSNDFYSFLTHDLEEAESFRLAKEEEHEKALFSGRKSRRERRAHREKRLANRKISPPSYAAREPVNILEAHQKSESRSPSPENTGKITFITSFGDEEEPQMPSKPTYADKVKYGSRLKRLREDSEERVVFRDMKEIFKRSRSRDRSFRRRSRRSSSRSKRFRSRRSSSSSSGRSRRSRRRRSLSRSKKKSISKSPSKSRSTSPACSIPVPPKREESPPKLVTRYYGRRKSDLSSSDICDSSDDGHAPEKTETNSLSQNSISKTGNSGSSTKSGNSTSAAAVAAAAAASAQSTSLSLQERLKRKRQALLNKQFKADKIAEQMKTEREKQEQQTREDELREMAIKLRRKQRERRHAYESNSSDNSSDNEAGNAGSSTCDRRSRSPSPKSHQSRSYRDRRSRDRDYRKSDKDDDYRRNRSRGRSRDRHRKSPSREEDRKLRDDYDDRRRGDEYSRRSRDYRNDDHKRSDKDRDREERSFSSRGLVDY